MSRLRSRVDALHRRIAAAELADAADYHVFIGHVGARIRFGLDEGPDPGPLPAAGQRWKDLQPEMSAEESAELLRALRRLVGEPEDGPLEEDVR